MKEKDTIILSREIINKVGEESGGWKETIETFNQLISELIEGESVQRKTDVLIYGLEEFGDMYTELRNTPNLKNTTTNLNIIVHFRLFLDCVLALDSDLVTINDMYVLFKISGDFSSHVHEFVKLMVKICDLLDRAIVYLFENLNIDSKDYFPIIESKIRKYLNEYKDDDTGWNKIYK